MQFDEFSDKFIRGAIVLAYDLSSKENIRYMWVDGKVKFKTIVTPYPIVSEFSIEDLYSCVNRNGSRWVVIDKFSKRCI